MYLPWKWAAPVPERPEVLTWTSLTEREADALRHLAADRVCLEIGAAFGYSTAVIASVADDRGYGPPPVWSIDPHNVVPGGVQAQYHFFDGQVPEGFESTADALERLLGELGLKHRVTPCLGYSHDLIAPPLGELLADPDFLKYPVTFCFIDGDHSYKAAFADLVACMALPLPPGMERTIALHDFGEDTNPDVSQVVLDWIGLFNEPPCTLELIDTLAVLRVRAAS